MEEVKLCQGGNSRQYKRYEVCVGEVRKGCAVVEMNSEILIPFISTFSLHKPAHFVLALSYFAFLLHNGKKDNRG